MSKPDSSNKTGPSVLLTGFGPFPDMAVNASARYVNALEKLGRRNRTDARINHAILPTQWVKAPKAVSRMRRRFVPDIILHFGVSKQARGIIIEQVARNFCDQSKDAVGAMPENNFVIAGAPFEMKSTLPIKQITSTLTCEEIPFELSQDAGSYLCNAVLYHSVPACIKKSPADTTEDKVITGFIHLPSDLGKPQCPLTWRKALTAGRIILNACYFALKDRPSQPL